MRVIALWVFKNIDVICYYEYLAQLKIAWDQSNGEAYYLHVLYYVIFEAKIYNSFRKVFNAIFKFIVRCPFSIGCSTRIFT
jgi:hypothetical protein